MAKCQQPIDLYVGRLSVNTLTNTVRWSVAINMSANSQSTISRHIGQHADQESAEMIDWESADISTDMSIKYRLIVLTDTWLRGAQITQDSELVCSENGLNEII